MEHIKTVVGRCTVCTEAHIDALFQHLGNRGKAVSELHVAGRIGDHTDSFFL